MIDTICLLGAIMLSTPLAEARTLVFRGHGDKALETRLNRLFLEGKAVERIWNTGKASWAPVADIGFGDMGVES